MISRLTLRVRLFLFFLLMMLAAPAAIGVAITLAVDAGEPEARRLLPIYTGTAAVLVSLLIAVVWRQFDRHIAGALQGLAVRSRQACTRTRHWHSTRMRYATSGRWARLPPACWHACTSSRSMADKRQRRPSSACGNRSSGSQRSSEISMSVFSWSRWSIGSCCSTSVRCAPSTCRTGLACRARYWTSWHRTRWVTRWNGWLPIAHAGNMTLASTCACRAAVASMPRTCASCPCRSHRCATPRETWTATCC